MNQSTKKSLTHIQKLTYDKMNHPTKKLLTLYMTAYVKKQAVIETFKSIYWLTGRTITTDGYLWQSINNCLYDKSHLFFI